jgi:peptide/nickel transport system substrate-binding protein
MKKRIVIILFVLTLTSLALAACAPQESPADTASSADEAGASAAGNADSVVAYVGTTIFDGSLDPIKGAMSYGYPFTNAALLAVNLESEYVGDMAVDRSVSADALVYDFTLREGVRFSDGSDFTAEDVVFTYETVKANQADNENVDLTRLARVEAIGDYGVRFTLSEPFSPFLDTTALLGIVPSDAYDSAAFDTKPVGTGPWQVVQYDANQQIIVEPNPHYYGGVPSIPRVTLVYMDNDAALAAARSGQLDVVMVNPGYAGEEVSGMTVFPLETMDIRLISLPVNPETVTGGVRTGNNVTSDINVRKALAIGIDRATIIENAFNGIGKPAVGFTSNLLWASGSSYADDRKDEANALLEAAGWIDADGDGFREKNGVVCEFDINAPEDRYTLAVALAEDAALLGIKINAHAVGWDVIMSEMGFAGVVWGWGQYSPTVVRSLFDSRAAAGGFDNVIGYANPEVDALIDRAIAETSPETAIADWKRAQEKADADYPYLYLVNIEHCYFVGDRLDISVDTQIPHPHGHGSPIICNMKDWTIQE